MQNIIRWFFKRFNRFMLWMWCRGMGPQVNAWPPVMGRIMVITTTGRKSGQPRQTPVNYARIDGDVYCTAGFGAVSDWYRNLRSSPLVHVWLPDEKFSAQAEELTPIADHLPQLRQVLINSGFAAFAAGINPYRVSDAQLADLCRDYRLIHLRRAE